MARNGLMARAKPYPLVVDTRYESSTQNMIADLKSGEIDVAVLWGPIAGYYAKKSDEPLVVAPLLKEKKSSHLVFRITMGVRASDQEWKRTLNKLLRDNQKEINGMLLGPPGINFVSQDSSGYLLTAQRGAAPTGPAPHIRSARSFGVRQICAGSIAAVRPVASL